MLGDRSELEKDGNRKTGSLWQVCVYAYKCVVGYYFCLPATEILQSRIFFKVAFSSINPILVSPTNALG